MAVRTYNPKDFVLAFGGVPLTGFIDGDAIEFEFDEDSFTKVTGLDGQVARFRLNNDSAKLTVKLMSTSPSNDYLSALSLADRITGEGVREVLLKQLNGNTAVFSQSAWIMKPPALTIGKEIPEMEWVLDLADTEFFYGSLLPI